MTPASLSLATAVAPELCREAMAVLVDVVVHAARELVGRSAVVAGDDEVGLAGPEGDKGGHGSPRTRVTFSG